MHDATGHPAREGRLETGEPALGGAEAGDVGLSCVLVGFMLFWKLRCAFGSPSFSPAVFAEPESCEIHTTMDQDDKTESGTPRFLKWLGIIILVLSLYVLSPGPLVYLRERGVISESMAKRMVVTIYVPLVGIDNGVLDAYLIRWIEKGRNDRRCRRVSNSLHAP